MAALQGSSNYRVTVALDIGTYASGYAFQFASDFDRKRLDFFANKNWDAPRCPGLSTYKTPTCLLLRPDRSVEDFGYNADYKYSEWRSDMSERPDDLEEYYFFRHFKMCLYHRQTIDDDMPIEAAEGKHLPAIVVFSKTIEYLKTHAENHLKECGHIDDETCVYESAETRWVLTVPAIWHDSAKQLMRRAATLAGIPERSLILALEPECAAVYCSQLTKDALDIKTNDGKIRNIASPGSTVMVVDIGGGTVDISTMQFDDNSKMKQVHMSNGGPWGGVQVNEKILEYLVGVFGEAVMVEFSSKWCFEEFELRMDIEKEKRQVKGSSHGEKLFKLSLPNRLKKTWKRINKKKDSEAFTDMLKQNGIKCPVGRLQLDLDKVRQYFRYTVDGILNCLNDIIEGEDHKGLQIDAMIIVGGFAESPYVIETLRKGLEERGTYIPVVRPQEPQKAILFGAVLFGQDKDIITSRVMRHTYGVGMVMEFDAETHNEEEKFNDGNKDLANNVFRKHVLLNQSVKLNEWIAGKEYYPENDEQTTVSIYLYSSEKRDPIHTNEDGCCYIGKIDVDFGKSENDETKAVTVQFSFGGTELEVRAVTSQSGQEFTKRLAIR